jgi:hypothetical protein
MVNKRLKENILGAVENQLRMNEPKCTKETFDRLTNLGLSKNKAQEMIAAILLEEIYYMMKNKDMFNEKRYSKKLSQLPDCRANDENQ